MDKIDARKLGSEGRETLRKMVLRLRTQSGMNDVEEAQDERDAQQGAQEDTRALSCLSQ